MLVIKNLNLETANKIVSDLPSKKDYLLVKNIELTNRYLYKTIERAYILVDSNSEIINNDFSYFPTHSFNKFKIKELLTKFKDSKVIIIDSEVNQNLQEEFAKNINLNSPKDISSRYKTLFLTWLFKKFKKKIKFTNDYTKINLCQSF